MNPKHFLHVVHLLFSAGVFAQTGGVRSFEFLEVPESARLAALGGVNVSLADRDPNFIFSNPALVSDSMAHWASVSYQQYVADIGHSSVVFRPVIKGIGSFSVAVKHMNYGSIPAYDPAGFEIGTFRASETALLIGKSHQVSHFRLGANIKAAFSSIAGFNSSTLLVDLGGVFVHPSADFTVGMVFRNIGFVVSEYTDTSQSSIPFDLQAGTTFKPAHMPLRFSLTVYRLGPAFLDDEFTGQGNDPSALDKVLGHINFGAEILLHRSINVLFGYNFRIHEELRQEETGGGAGLSFGFSARVKSYEFTFSRNSYIVGTAGYTFTLSADTSQLWKRIKQL